MITWSSLFKISFFQKKPVAAENPKVKELLDNIEKIKKNDATLV